MLAVVKALTTDLSSTRAADDIFDLGAAIGANRPALISQGFDPCGLDGFTGNGPIVVVPGALVVTGAFPLVFPLFAARAAVVVAPGGWLVRFGDLIKNAGVARQLNSGFPENTVECLLENPRRSGKVWLISQAVQTVLRRRQQPELVRHSVSLASCARISYPYSIVLILC